MFVQGRPCVCFPALVYNMCCSIAEHLAMENPDKDQDIVC